MRLKLQAFSRYRPRVLTLVVVFLVGAVLALANLTWEMTYDPQPYRRGVAHGRTVYGWPLIWHWDNFGVSAVSGFGGKVDSEYSAARLVVNVAVWLLMTIAPAATCEWLLRRYRPRLRWSLRTMLFTVAVVAVLCGLFATARNRAETQDALIAKMAARGGENVWVERWGPKWLDFLGVDHFRRHFVGANMLAGYGEDEKHQDDLVVFDGLSRSPELQFLHIKVLHCTPDMSDRLSRMQTPNLQNLALELDCLTPGIAEALARLPKLRALSLDVREISPGAEQWLGEMRQLRTLRINQGSYGDERLISRRWLSAVAKMTQLEHLQLARMTIGGESLSGLTHLKSLSLTQVSADEPPLLAQLPVLPRLESLDVGFSEVCDGDLRHLSIQPRLTSLNLAYTDVTDAGLAQLASVRSLEELQLDREAVSVACLESLQAIEHLKVLHIEGYRMWNASRRQRAFEDFRESNPGLVIDGTRMPGAADEVWGIRAEYDLAR